MRGFFIHGVIAVDALSEQYCDLTPNRRIGPSPNRDPALISLVFCSGIADQPDLKLKIIARMDQDLLRQLQPLAEQYLARCSGKILKPLAAGGSAAVYVAENSDKIFALKVYDPTLLEGKNGPAELRRIELQRGLIGHRCRYLVQLEAVVAEPGGCYVEMTYLPWDTLKKVLPQIPDAVIPQLLSQLVEAARFLDQCGIVHRDIKPENILICYDPRYLRIFDPRSLRAM